MSSPKEKGRRFAPPGYRERLSSARKATGLDRKQIANKAGIEYHQAQLFDGGGFGGDFENWRRFTEALGVRWQWLLTNEGEEKFDALREEAPPPPIRPSPAAKAEPPRPKRQGGGRARRARADAT